MIIMPPFRCPFRLRFVGAYSFIFLDDRQILQIKNGRIIWIINELMEDFHLSFFLDI